jgi:signal transduction histidine kinase/streptogramin lyase
MYETQAGALWVGTFKEGVNVYDPVKSKFATVRHKAGESNSLSDNAVRAFWEDRRGELWVGTEEGGLDRYNPHTDTFTHYLHDERDPHSLSANTVIALCEDTTGALWIGTYGGGLDRFDRRRNTFIHYKHDAKNIHSIADNRIKALYADRDGDIWIGFATATIDKYDPGTDSFIGYELRDSTSGAEAQGMTQGIDGDIWIATFGDGLYRLNKTTGRIKHYRNNQSDPHALFTSALYCVTADAEGNLWIGSFGRGLFRYNNTTDSFTSFTEENGLPSNFIKGVLVDTKNNLWLSTSKGLAKFNARTLTCKNFDLTDGIQANEFRTGASYKGNNGKFYFGGEQGYNVFYPDSVRDNPNIPEVVISGFKVFDKPYPLGESIFRAKEITLSYSQDMFSFEFVALNYTNPEKNQYAYTLEGFDNNWISCGTRRYASYTHLDGGEYLFRVKASNNDGLWNERGASVKLIITPPYWKTWWFNISALLFAFVAVVRIIRAIEMRKMREKLNTLERETALERERTRIARDMHDDIGSRLTEIRLLSELSQQDPIDQRNIKSNLTEISDTARDIVDSFQEIVWSVNPKYDTLDNFADYLTQYASGYLAKAGLLCRLDIPTLLPHLKMSADIRHNLMMVVKEALNNTVKHAGAKMAELNLSFTDSCLTVVIRDDGKGFSLEQGRHFGDGLANMRRRIELIDGKIHIDSTLQEGTTVTLSVAMDDGKK